MARSKVMKRRAGRPLPSSEVLKRIRGMVKLIEYEVKIGLEIRASLEIANDLIRKSAGKNYYAAGCVGSIQGSQAMYLSLILAKLFEMPRPRPGETHARRYNRSDAASIPLLIRLVRQKRAREHLGIRARRWTPMIRSFADGNARACDEAIDRAVLAYDALRKTKGGRAAMLRLRSFRNNLLAHLLLNSSRRVRPRYSEIFLLLDSAREVINHVALAVDGRHMQLADYEAERVRVARAFWDAALPAAMAERQRATGAT